MTADDICQGSLMIFYHGALLRRMELNGLSVVVTSWDSDTIYASEHEHEHEHERVVSSTIISHAFICFATPSRRCMSKHMLS